MQPIMNLINVKAIPYICCREVRWGDSNMNIGSRIGLFSGLVVVICNWL